MTAAPLMQHSDAETPVRHSQGVSNEAIPHRGKSRRKGSWWEIAD